MHNGIALFFYYFFYKLSTYVPVYYCISTRSFHCATWGRIQFADSVSPIAWYSE